MTPVQQHSPAKALFHGNILEGGFAPFPTLKAGERETVAMVIESVARFMGDYQERFREFDLKGEQSPEFLNGMKELGLFGIIIPEQYNGFGLSALAYSRIVQELARFDGSAALTIGAHTSIGMRGLLLFGTEDQKQRYLPNLATGETMAAFCLTEAGSGSDAASIKTRAEKREDGSWVLNGEKIWITNGSLAQFFTVFARTGEGDHALSAFIVERAFPGLSNGPKEDKMGIRSSATTTVSFQDVVIPAQNLLGKEGEGFKVAMTILNNGRTGLGGGCIGAMKQCIALASEHATNRKQFGKSLAEFPIIQHKLAWMCSQLFAAESVVTTVCGLIDSGAHDFSVEAAISKILVTEALWQVSNEALQIAGGVGFMREYPYERIVRDARINMIFEGTNEILRLYIALSGLKEAGAELKEMAQGISQIFNDPITAFGLLSTYVARKLPSVSSLGRETLAFPDSALRRESQILEHYVLRLANGVEAVLKTYGKKVVEEQLTLKRLADVAIELYAGLCTVARTSSLIQERGRESCDQEISMCKLYVQHAKRQMNLNLRRLARNEDIEAKLLAKGVTTTGRYRWDAAFE